MGRGTVRARAATAVALLASCAVVLGAGGPQGAVLPAAAALPPAQAPQQEQAGNDCDVYQSVPPSSEDGPAVKAIKAKRSLVIGIDQNSFRWGSRNPNTGQIEGFDIDLAKAVGTAIMGDPDKVVLKAVPTSGRVEFIQQGRVDLIVRTMTITCDRLQQVAFSKPYFSTSQRVVVPKASPAKTIDEAVDGRTVCAASSSSAEEELKARPKVGKIVSVENHLDCLVLMQLGKVDATMTDDGLAASQAAQDQTVRVVDGEVRPAVMGIAMLKNSTDLTARVNQVLADYHANGAWRAGYDRWLKPYMLNDADHYWPDRR
ncbi:glutamate ABC transporter substrate-binding protein [Streptomyces sp. CB01881]|uniref:glutamate ABC transporter substrate-binding protein n=1 Tax=Streptomyces sp. CB01881 TaxID=2078691 RepID=UPI0011DF06C4|nr:glutamate ABC transporter substrate-binding protein [Streptomyces sp. CB01881]TYC72914.1 glutamate ABC transporter substrate-binding protein [Streptomyces sp. CB01881]